MKFIRLSIFFILFSLLIFEISSETAGNSSNSILINCAYSDDEQLQLMALNSLLAKYKKEGTLEQEILKIPLDLAQGSIDDLQVQLRAIKVLGEIGGQQSLAGLSGILISSNDSIILTEVVNASSGINCDDYDCFINALGTVMKKQHSQFKNNGFAYASLGAIDNMTKTAGNILSSEILGIMMLYSNSEYDQEVRDYSRRLLQLILTER